MKRFLEIRIMHDLYTTVDADRIGAFDIMTRSILNCHESADCCWTMHISALQSCISNIKQVSTCLCAISYKHELDVGSTDKNLKVAGK